MIDPQKLILKLRKPPGVHNWVRNVRRRRYDMAQSLYNTAINAPRHSLRQVTDIIRQVVVDGIDDEQAYKCVEYIKNPRTHAYALQILRVILPYIREHCWEGVEVFKDMVEYYRVAANVNVPVRPTFVVNDGEKVIPYFVICWTEIGLSYYQRRILTTLIQEAILSLEEFDGSDAVIVCVPRYSFSKTERHVVKWNLSHYPQLSDDEKTDLFERYGGALSDAERMILENLD